MLSSLLSKVRPLCHCLSTCFVAVGVVVCFLIGIIYTDLFVFYLYVFVKVLNIGSPSTCTKSFKVRLHESQHLPSFVPF